MGYLKFMRTGVRELPSTSKSLMCSAGMISHLRVAGDTFFYADITLNDVILGSRYWIVDYTDNTVILSTGLITTNPQILTGIPAQNQPQVLMLRLRNASGVTKYKQYESVNVHQKTGTYFYCAQQVD